ncbi:histone-lysine N-methyltransferase SMYD3-like [Acanthaster planci]|uniref:Histone-lysine N-methyltransferase SMYD3-like n=1 Tax=Acanthaster planci TaxID=133434 RepID=A0A8B7XZB9_ACAPL|nr:histone-lysine N-methyltransferase SMYD3-like [Acanthaster planci]
MAEVSEKVEIFSDKKRGRGVRATTFIEPETVLLIENPYLLTLEEDYRRNRCSYCCKERGKLRACGGCSFVYYCDRQCQASNYSDHQYECKYLKMASAGGDIRVRTRTLLVTLQKHLKTVKKRSQNVATHNARGFPLTPEILYKKMADEKTSPEPDMERLWEYAASKHLPVTEDLMQTFEGILNANMFSVRDGKARCKVIGEGLYTRMAMFNHCCRPNCTFTSDNRELKIASIRPISPGEECTISYLNLMAPTSSRQSKLRKWYDFDCDCKRCIQDIDKDRLMYAIKCPQMNCRGSVLPWKPSDSLSGQYLACDACGFDISTSKLPDQIVRTEMEVESFLSRKKDYDYPGQYLEECGPILARLDDVYQPYHRRVYQVVKTALKAALKLDEAETALQYGTRSLVALRTHLDSCDTLLGFNLWQVGQLQARLGMNLKAVHTLEEALRTLRIAYGSHHAVTVEAQELLAMLKSGKDHLALLSDTSQTGGHCQGSNAVEN